MGIEEGDGVLAEREAVEQGRGHPLQQAPGRTADPHAPLAGGLDTVPASDLAVQPVPRMHVGVHPHRRGE